MLTVNASWISPGVGPNAPSTVFVPATAVNVGPGLGKSGGSPPSVPAKAVDGKVAPTTEANAAASPIALRRANRSTR